MNDLELKAAEVQLGVLKLQHLLLESQLKSNPEGHNQYTGGSGSVDQSSKPMSYQQFRASGKSDQEWDVYREEQNAISRQRGQEKLLNEWNQGRELGGNDVVNLLRARGVSFPENIQRVLEDDGTVVSKTSVQSRGVNRTEAKKIHRVVSEAMNQQVGNVIA